VTPLGDVDVGGIGKDDAKCWRRVAIVGRGLGVRAMRAKVVLVGHRDAALTICRGRRSIGVSLVKECWSRWPHCPYPLRGGRLALLEPAHQPPAIVVDTGPVAQCRACLQSGIGQIGVTGDLNQGFTARPRVGP